MKKPLPCEPASNPPIDLVNVEANATPEDVALARSVCARCPALAWCWEVVRGAAVAGVAAGMTRDEREEWQRNQGVSPQRPELLDVLPTRMLTRELVRESITRRHEQDGERADAAKQALILRATDEGLPAERIAYLIAGPPDALSADQDRPTQDEITKAIAHIAFVRRTYYQGVTRVLV